MLLGALATARLGVREPETVLPVRALVLLGFRRDGVGHGGRIVREAFGGNLGVRAKRHDGDLDLLVCVLAGEQAIRKGGSSIVRGLHATLVAPAAHRLVHTRRHVDDEHDIHRRGGRGLLSVASHGQREVIRTVTVVLNGLVVHGCPINEAAGVLRQRCGGRRNPECEHDRSGHRKQTATPRAARVTVRFHTSSSPQRLRADHAELPNYIYGGPEGRQIDSSGLKFPKRSHLPAEI